MADWDENSPEDNDLVSQYPANARTARAAVRSNFGVDHREQNDADVGKHEVIQLVDQEGDATIAEGQIGVWNDGGVLKHRTGTGAVRQVDGIPSGTRMVFVQAEAPVGWTQDTDVNDRVLRVVDSGGGATGGSWTISGVTVNNHTLTVAQIPSHNHGGATGSAGGHSHSASTNTTGAHTHGMRTGGTTGSVLGFQTQANRGSTMILDVPGAQAGSAGAHSHTVNIDSVSAHSHSIPSQGGGAGHNHGLTADGSWRPSYIDVIVATRD